jgi:hypothetical protein
MLFLCSFVVLFVVTCSFFFFFAVFSGGDVLLNEDMFPLKALHILDTFYWSALFLFLSYLNVYSMV